jgi:hypothetical protein
LIFVSSQRLEITQEHFIAGAPDLVVEILSPSTAAHDRATKLNLYAEVGEESCVTRPPVIAFHNSRALRDVGSAF